MILRNDSPNVWEHDSRLKGTRHEIEQVGANVHVREVWYWCDTGEIDHFEERILPLNDLVHIVVNTTPGERAFFATARTTYPDRDWDGISVEGRVKEDVMRLQGWFKPRYVIVIDGMTWISDGQVAIEAPAPAGLKEPKSGTESMKRYIETATEEPGDRTETNGYVLLRAGSVAYQGHFFGLVEAAYPGVAWSVSGYATPHAVARLDGRAVGVVMPLRSIEDIKEPMPPKCPVCSGRKGPECPKCGGAGSTECVCRCGHEREDECDTCGGRGVIETCGPCMGTGVWTPEMDAAA
jgi:hypothetical protein